MKKENKMDEKIETTFGNKTVKFGDYTTKIPKYMNKDYMVECWETDSKELISLAQNIVENNPMFAYEIVDAWLKKNKYLLLPKDFEGVIYREPKN
jgi:hypothetical protein